MKARKLKNGQQSDVLLLPLTRCTLQRWRTAPIGGVLDVPVSDGKGALVIWMPEKLPVSGQLKAQRMCDLCEGRSGGGALPSQGVAALLGQLR